MLFLLVAVSGCGHLQKTFRGVEQEAKGPDYFERKRLCMELASRMYEEEVRISTRFSRAPEVAYTVIDPEYCYSEELHTCLYAGGTLGKKSEDRWVRDCLTNKRIVDSFVAYDGTLISGIPKSEFERRKGELMATCAK